MACPRHHNNYPFEFAYSFVMRICPVDLERCDRTACSSGACQESGERTLIPCVDCGVLIVSGTGVCVTCISVSFKETEEA